MSSKQFFSLAAGGALLLVGVGVGAQDLDVCQPLCAPVETVCEPAPPIESPPIATYKTVLVPKVFTEYQTKMVTRYRPEKRERMRTVQRNVPTVETIDETYTVMVPEVRTRTVVDKIRWPAYSEIELRKTDMTPKVETRTSTRTVCRLVPVQEERVTYDAVSSYVLPTMAHTVGYRGDAVVTTKKPIDEPAGRTFASEPPPAAPEPAPLPPGAVAPLACASTCEPVCRKTCVTCMKPVYEKETIEYPVTHFESKPRMQTVSFTEYQTENRSRKEKHTVEVPETRVRQRQVTVMRQVAERQPETYTEMVAYQEEVRVPVRVVRNVEEQVRVLPEPCP